MNPPDDALASVSGGRRQAKITAKGQATRNRLLAAAQHELQERGTVEIADVAARVGVAQSVLYRYFGSKSGMVEAVVNRFYDEYDHAVFLAPIAPEASWLERETLRIEQEIAFLYRHPLGKRVAAGLLHEASATRVDAERQHQHAAMAARNIRHGQRTGELAPSINADLVGAAIIGALRAVLAKALSSTPTPSQTEVADILRLMSTPLLRPRTEP